MTDWAPQVVLIEKVEKHPDADALDVCTVLGDYPVITKRDEYKIGDLAAYIPIDTIVPDTDYFHFLCPKAYEKYEDETGQFLTRQLGPKFAVGQVPEKYRVIKAKKIRGIYSQGMLMPIPDSCFEVRDELTGHSTCLMVGDTVVDIFKLKKWEEEEEENLPGLNKARGTNAEKAPQGWAIPYYDINSLRKYLSCIENEKDVILTEKLNGSNAGFCFDGEKLYCKSRNFYKKRDEEDMWWDAAIRYDLENKLSKYPMLVFFAELVNQVKNFRYSTTIVDGTLQTQLYFFDIWDAKKLRYLDYDEFLIVIRDVGLVTTPELYRGPWKDKEKMYAYAEGKSTLNEKVIREGFVLRLGKERYEPRVDGRCQFKLIGELYNLSK